MPRSLDEARRLTRAGEYKKALRELEILRWDDGVWADGDVASLEHGATLAREIAQKTEGRQRRRAEHVSGWLVGASERLSEALGVRDVSRRVELNATAFILMATAEELGEETMEPEAFELISQRITRWRRTLEPCFLSGYQPVERFGVVPMSEVEQARLHGLMTETVNEIVLEHAGAVEDIRSLRNAIPACLGFAASRDDVRLKELLSTLQRHSGKSLELPSNLAMTTALLDAMEAAGPPADEREFFKAVAGAAFYSGVGAGLKDVIDSSTTASPE